VLNRAIGRFEESKPYRVRREPHPDGVDNHYSGILEDAIQPPLRDWGLMAGDVVHALRSALDNLAYALEVAHSGPPADPKKVRVQFVICDDVKDWESVFYHIKRLSPAAQATIKGLQPYNRTDPNKIHSLSVLRDLANVDKHRELLLVLTAINRAALTVSTALEQQTQITGYEGPFEDGKVVAVWKEVGRPPNLKVNMDVKLSFEIRFAYGWPAWGWNVPEQLKGMADFIENGVFPDLEPFLR
jgi:hypothetical protein